MEETVKRYYLGIGMMALVLVLAGTAAFAAPAVTGQGAPGRAAFGGPSTMGHHHHGMGALLGLTDDQKARMKEIRNRFSAETHDLRYDLMQKRVEMRKLFTDPKVDSARLLDKEKELSALREKLQSRRAQMKIEWRGVLTPEQIQKLDQAPVAHRMGRGMHRGMM